MNNLVKEYPLVSVVLATYNGELYLREQLDSIFIQTYQRMEVVAIDDCSSDTTVSILNEYAAIHANMRVFLNKKNLKHIKTFERGITLANGTYIVLCDQDDIWDKEKIAITIAEMKEGVTLAYCDSLLIDGQGRSLNKKISEMKNLASYNNAMPFIIGNCVAGHAAIFEKKLALMAMPFPDQIIHDWWLAFVASMNGRIAFVNEPLVKYRQHSSSVIGAVKLNGRAKEEIDKQKIIRERIRYFLEACGNSDSETKNVLTALQKSYSGFSLANNFSRMFTFFKYQKKLLATKKRSRFRKWLFCIKMFFIII